MTVSNVSPSTQPDDGHSRLVEELLKPLYPLFDLSAALAGFSEGNRRQFEQLNAKREADRARLMALPLADLQAMRAKQLEQSAAREADRIAAEQRRKAEAAEKEARKEAAKFYNLPSADADFQHWARMEHWTFDEALALLLGKDPRVVTRSAVQRELSPDYGLMLFSTPQRPKAGFLRTYENLRHVAERAAAMKAPRLRPVDVLLWAHRSGAIEPPAALVREVTALLRSATPTEARPPSPKQDNAPAKLDAAQPAAAEAPLPMKRAALITKHERTWPTIVGDLRHANENGLSDLARADRHGYWLEAPALQWARQNGKLTSASTEATHSAHAPFGRVHRMDD